MRKRDGFQKMAGMRAAENLRGQKLQASRTPQSRQLRGGSNQRRGETSSARTKATNHEGAPAETLEPLGTSALPKRNLPNRNRPRGPRLPNRGRSITPHLRRRDQLREMHPLEENLLKRKNILRQNQLRRAHLASPKNLERKRAPEQDTLERKRRKREVRKSNLFQFVDGALQPNRNFPKEPPKCPPFARRSDTADGTQMPAPCGGKPTV